MTETAPAISIRSLSYAYKSGQTVLEIDSFEMEQGAQLFLQGASGSGKSTLLGIIAGVMAPQKGDINILGQDMSSLSPSSRDSLRAERMGVIFQMFNLLPFLGVGANVLLSCRFSTERVRRAAAKNNGDLEGEARRLLTRLGLPPDDFWGAPVSDLSVGQQQRVAAARALIGEPDLILADEPTSALDTDNREAFIDLLLEETTARGASLLFVSHDVGLAARFPEVMDLKDINRAGVVSA